MRNPFLPMTVVANDAQCDEAIKNTRETCVKLRDMCRDLDLPATAFDTVAMLFHGQIGAIVSRDALARENKITMQMNAILARKPSPPGAYDDGYGQPFVRPMPLRSDPYEQKLIAMTDAELDAEYQRVVVDSKT